MRSSWWATALVFLLITPTIIAQGDTTTIGSDSEGDSATGQDRLDLQELSAHWDEGNVVWELTTGTSAVPSTVPGVDSVLYHIHFKVGSREYVAYAEKLVSVVGAVEGDRWLSGLLEFNGVEWTETQEGDSPREEGAVISWTTPSIWLADERGIPFLPGQSLTDLWAASYGFVENFYLLSGDVPPNDRLPDSGAADPLQRPGEPESDALYRLLSPAPVRSSNGGPSLTAYELELFNGADGKRSFDLVATGYPDAWNVRVVPDLLSLDAMSTSSVIVVVESSGGHTHAEDDRFELVASTSDGEARTELVLHYPAVPELSKHHSTVWFHSAVRDSPFPEVDGAIQSAIAQEGPIWMNTVEDDEADEENPMAAEFIDGNPVWNFPLLPSPRLGFDFDLDSVGNIQFRLEPQHAAPIDNIELHSDLQVFENGDWVSVATIPPEGPFTLTADGQDFDLSVTPTRDVVPYHPDLQLRISIGYDYQPTSTSTGQGANQPLLQPGGTAMLPMDEYLDPISPELAGLLKDQGVIDDEGDLVPTAPEATKEAPFVAVPALIAGLAIVLTLRRRIA